MYDLENSTVPFAIGEEAGPIMFQVGGGGSFHVFITQGGANTNFGPGHAAVSQGGQGDTVRVLRNGLPFDNSAGCIEGAVDFNTTSPNFTNGHNVFELEVKLAGFTGGCYLPEPAFWSATLPVVTAVVQSAELSLLQAGSQEPAVVSEAFVDIDTGTGETIVTAVVEGPPGDATCSDGIDNDGDGALDGDDSDCLVAPSHDAQLRRIQTSFSVLGGLFDAENPDQREIFVQVRNESDHTDTIGVYIDVIPPRDPLQPLNPNPYDCQPFGRILEGSITLNARGTSGDTGNIFVDTHTPNLAGSTTGGVGHVDFSCGDQLGAVGKTYTLIVVVDHGANDLASCGPGTLLAMGPTNCFSKLADDDIDPADNRLSRSAPRVKKPQLE